jgi:hypothetical protein
MNKIMEDLVEKLDIDLNGKVCSLAFSCLAA